MDVAPLQTASRVVAPAEVAVSAGQPAENRRLIEAVHAVNATELFGQDNELSFVLDRGSQRPVIRIVNRKTNEVIRQIPPEYVLRLAEAMRSAGQHK
ncbi:MAG TPA: flagellar protein FlaG [Bryobacteraceae bacterium]|nr:flagellar protein FlaG [Bryobacteraceae bacterium]